MPNFFEYNPEQPYLLPPSVRDVFAMFVLRTCRTEILTNAVPI